MDRTEQVTLTGPGSVALGSTPYTSCGENGCPRYQMGWGMGYGHDGLGFISGCGPLDYTCTVGYQPPAVGDRGEYYALVYAQPALGIYAHGDPIVWAIYTPPLVYPVEVHPVNTSGVALTVPVGFAAYAIAPGANPTQADCLEWQWQYDSYRSQVDLPKPPCIELARNGNFISGKYWYEGSLPNDSGTWTIVAGPGGDPSAPLLSRVSGYRRTTVKPASDDIVTTIVAEREPTLDVLVTPETTNMDIGTTQQIQVVVSAIGGDVGELNHLTFEDAAILAVGVGDAPAPVVQVLDTVEAIPPEGFTLARGASRTFLVDLQAIGLGEAQVDAGVSGRDLLGNPVRDGAGGPILVEYSEDLGDAIPPPVVTSARDVSNGTLDPIEGTVDGEAGTTVTVSLASSPVLDAAKCSQLMSGEGVNVVGSTSVDIGTDGKGSFALQGSLLPGSYVYGITTSGPKVSRVGDCTRVTEDTPTISILGVADEEGNGSGGTTPFVFTISLSSPSTSPVSVGVGTTDVTATAPGDYEALALTTLTLAPGETSRQVTVQVVRDTTEEPDEEFQVGLADPVHGVIDGEGVATGTIVDDDATAATGDLDVRGTWTLTPLKETIGGKHQVPITFRIKKQDAESGDIAGSLPTDYGVIKISGTIAGNKLSLLVKRGSASTRLSGTLKARNGTLTGVVSGSSSDGTVGGYRLVIVPLKGR
jgi:hypothetical protein